MSAGIGGQLKEARDRKSVTLEEVHSRIKIHPRILQLLEDEKFDRLPNPVFAKSFLKSYGEFLELNTDELMAQYEKHVGRPEPVQTLIIPSASDKQRASAAQKNIWITLFVIAAIGAGVYALNNVTRTVDRWSAKSPAKAMPAGRQGSKPAKAAVKSEPAKETAAASGWLRNVEQGNFPRIGSKVPLKLQLTALDAVWVRVTCDGKVLFESILKRGASEGWNADTRIDLWTGNAGKMALVLNGTPLGSPGKGSAKKMSITHEGVKFVA